MGVNLDYVPIYVCYIYTHDVGSHYKNVFGVFTINIDSLEFNC